MQLSLVPSRKVTSYVIALLLLYIRFTSSDKCYTDIHGICLVSGLVAMIQIISEITTMPCHGSRSIRAVAMLVSS
jgi:hypothetical protein